MAVPSTSAEQLSRSASVRRTSVGDEPISPSEWAAGVGVAKRASTSNRRHTISSDIEDPFADVNRSSMDFAPDSKRATGTLQSKFVFPRAPARVSALLPTPKTATVASPSSLSPPKLRSPEQEARDRESKRIVAKAMGADLRTREDEDFDFGSTSTHQRWEGDEGEDVGALRSPQPAARRSAYGARQLFTPKTPGNASRLSYPYMVNPRSDSRMTRSSLSVVDRDSGSLSDDSRRQGSTTGGIRWSTFTLGSSFQLPNEGDRISGSAGGPRLSQSSHGSTRGMGPAAALIQLTAASPASAYSSPPKGPLPPPPLSAKEEVKPGRLRKMPSVVEASSIGHGSYFGRQSRMSQAGGDGEEVENPFASSLYMVPIDVENPPVAGSRQPIVRPPDLSPVLSDAPPTPPTKSKEILNV